MQPSPGQLVRLRRIALASAASLIHLSLCWAAYAMGFMTLSLAGMLVLTLVVLMTGSLFLLMTRFGFNLRFRDPSLTLPQICWAILLIFVSAYFAGDLRPMFLMMVLLVLMFGAFRLEAGGFLRIGAFILISYLTLIYAQLRSGAVIELRLELMNGLEFMLLCVGVSMLGLDTSRLRNQLQERNHDLRTALERIQQLAITDELTGLYNRRFAKDLMSQQKALADRGTYGFVLCMLDIDFFKRINDNFGHAGGDAVLQQLAEHLRAAVRDVDFVARFGGEEFLLLLSGADEEGARQVLERLRQSLKGCEWSGCPGLQLTVSIGVSRYQTGEDWHQTLLRVDEALYRAKHNGRNQVVLL